MITNKNATKYDYIVVGAGSSGCALAYRLAQQTNAQVVLIEAGGPDRNPLIRAPIGFAALIGKGRHNWGYETEPEQTLGGRQVPLPRGRVWGGCSAINGMVYVRGHKADYDAWAAQGNTGWDYESLLPLFRKSEDHWRGVSHYHGAGGELAVRPVATSLPIADSFIEAAQQDGLPHNADFNGGSQLGAGHFDVNISGGKRHSASRAFLHNQNRPPNLTILSHASVNQVLITDGRATGVRITHKNRVMDVRASAEVILSAGSLNTPQILERSGIGDADRLQALGIEVVRHNPAVGENLKDHFNTLVTLTTQGCHTYHDDLQPSRVAQTVLNYTFRKRGIFANPAATSGAFLKVDDNSNRPDAQIHFAPAASVQQANGSLKPIQGVCASICRLHPDSTGSVHIRSQSVDQTPALQMNYLRDGNDAAFQVRAVRRLRSLFRQPALAQYVDQETLPGDAITDDDALLGFIRDTGDSVHHPVGTCRMGVDDNTVVDPQLRVRGIDCLRIADASIFPTVITGNTHAPCVMMGEKAADLISSGL